MAAQQFDFSKFFTLKQPEQKKIIDAVEEKLKKNQKTIDNLNTEKNFLETERNQMLVDLTNSVPMVVRDELEKENNKHKNLASNLAKELEAAKARIANLEKASSITVKPTSTNTIVVIENKENKNTANVYNSTGSTKVQETASIAYTSTASREAKQLSANTSSANLNKPQSVSQPQQYVQAHQPQPVIQRPILKESNPKEWADEMNRTAVQDKIEIELLDKLAGQENVIEELIAENSKLMIELYRHRNKSLR